MASNMPHKCTVQYNHSNTEQYKHHKLNTKYDKKLKTVLKMVERG